jgi:hypothetical protein
MVRPYGLQPPGQLWGCLLRPVTNVGTEISTMHPLFVLAFMTFAGLLAFLAWNYYSTRRNQETGGRTTGVGGPDDPMAGATPGIRSPDEMRAALDAMHSPRHRIGGHQNVAPTPSGQL